MVRDIAKLGICIPFVPLLFPLAVVAQETPRFEVFGGYSYLRLTAEPSSALKAASLNGWNASVKLNLTPRIGFVADLSGNYGQRGMTPFSYFLQEGSVIRTNSGRLRQNTFLFGPEFVLVHRGRISVNTRALIGVAQTNTLVVPFVEPIQEPLGPNGEFVTISNRSFYGGNGFAASIGGSLDYRITSRWSYRIAQPEVLLVRSSGAEATQTNLRLSTGILYSFGPSVSPDASERRVSFGIIGGGSLTDGYGQQASYPVALPGGGTGLQRERWASTRKDYIVGPMVQIGLEPHLALEIDALYRPLNFSYAFAQPGEPLRAGESLTVVTWEFPSLVKYMFARLRSVNPFIEMGPSFRSSGNLNGTAPSSYGGTAGLGVTGRIWKLQVAPVLRYTHWAADKRLYAPQTKRNQVEVLVGVSF